MAQATQVTQRVSALKLHIPMSKLKTDFADFIRNKYDRDSLSKKRWEDRSITDCKDVYLACEEAYFLGAVFRRAREGRGRYVNTPNVNEALEKLAKNLHSFFNKENGPFSFFKLCYDFRNNLNEKRKMVKTEEYAAISFGQAQKMINLTIKYLYCYGDSENFKDRFELCHAPMDSIMEKSVGNELAILNYPGEYTSKTKYCAWTALELENVYIYEAYRDGTIFLAKYASFQLEKDVIPLEIDFYLWDPKNNDD